MKAILIITIGTTLIIGALSAGALVRVGAHHASAVNSIAKEIK